MSWPCYWLESTGTAALGLRRYAYAGGSGSAIHDCAAGNHEAFAWRGLTVPERFETRGDGTRLHTVPDPVDRDDQAWPRACGRCGHPFAGTDRWQEWAETLYRRADGALVMLHTGLPGPPGAQPAHAAGPGAMWDGWWLPEDWRGPDGIGLIVRCPDPAQPARAFPHDWTVDAVATGGGRWTRTGDPRDPATLTVSPSIAIGHPGSDGYYHGFLQGGALTGHLG